MANSWFRFRQFIVHQDRCAMKVGTDGVLLGALAEISPRAEPAFNSLSSGGNILDIGTGTGLIALMLAQRSAGLALGVQIDAVEIDRSAAEQAAENARNSPWGKQIRVIHGDFMEFYPSCGRKYDLIAGNPPYFRNSLRPAGREKELARHGSSEFYRELLRGSSHLLRPSGKCCFILPPDLAAELTAMAPAAGLYPERLIHIYSKPGERIFRQVITLKNRQAADRLSESELTIHQSNGSYTTQFRHLMRPFYLNL